MTLDAKTVHIEEIADGKVVQVTLSGALSAENYERFTPELERSIDRHGKIRLLIELIDFEGWDAGALWEDVKFDWKHFNDFERIAIVGERKWEKGMALFCKPFTTATIQFFDSTRRQEAAEWVAEGVESGV